MPSLMLRLWTVKTNSVAATSSITQIIYGTGKYRSRNSYSFSGYTFDSWEIISPTPSIKRTNPWTISNINDHYYAIAQYKDSSSGGSGSSEEGVCAVRGTLPIHGFGFDGRIPDPTFGDYCGSLGVTQCLNSVCMALSIVRYLISSIYTKIYVYQNLIYVLIIAKLFNWGSYMVVYF